MPSIVWLYHLVIIIKNYFCKCKFENSHQNDATHIVDGLLFFHNFYYIKHMFASFQVDSNVDVMYRTIIINIYVVALTTYNNIIVNVSYPHMIRLK